MLGEKLDLIDLDIPQLGYLKFISSWLYTSSEGTFLVDPGPACTIPILLRSLEKKRVETINWILLTHIHQDHAGGLGELIKIFPMAKVVTHEKGAKHLIDPTKLWEASKQILGDVSKVYGKILPVPEENVFVKDKIPFSTGIKVIPTPGHASHHQCFMFKDWFFTGELFGAHIPMKNGLYLRPATPHRFELEDYLNSMKSVEPYLKPNMCFAHYGIGNDPKRILKTSRKQLQLWMNVIDENIENQNMDQIFKELLENDDIFALYNQLDRKMRKREKHFSINSIQGIMKYLESR